MYTNLKYLSILPVLAASICPLAQADELSDLKAKVNQLEKENQKLKSKLDEHNISMGKKTEKEEYEEKSIAGVLGLAPEEKPLVKGGFIDFNYYYDDRNLNVLTIHLLASLPADIEYFSLNDMTATADSKGSEVFNLTGYYMEHHFRRPIAKDHQWLGPLDWTVQYVDGSSAKDLIRLGTRVRTQDIQGPIGQFIKDTLGLWLNVDFHWYESDGDGMEIEPVYGGSYFDGLLLVGGFADIDFGNKHTGDNAVVTEHQVGLKIVDNLYYITEIKFNGFRDKGDQWSTAFGLKYTIPFLD